MTGVSLVVRSSMGWRHQVERTVRGGLICINCNVLWSRSMPNWRTECPECPYDVIWRLPWPG